MHLLATTVVQMCRLLLPLYITSQIILCFQLLLLMKLNYRWSVVLGYECHFNSLLNYITLLSIIQVFGLHSVSILPALFSPTPKATHVVYSIHSRPNRSRVHLCVRTVLCSVFNPKWLERFRKSSTNTRNACRRCLSFRGVHTDVGWYVKTVVQTGISSRTFSAIMALLCSS